MVLVLTLVVLQSISFANYALTTTTTNIIYGSAPYLTFDGGRTRVTNTEALLWISLSDGRTFTPTTNNSSSTNPIELPVVGQSFNDIGMLVPTDTNSIELSSLIGTPYNYWGDDDGDGQGVNGVTATGSLNVSIVDKDNYRVPRNKVLTICNNDRAPYRLNLFNSEGTLKTRYGVPNESRFTAGRATYYIKPNQTPAVCYARPNVLLNEHLVHTGFWSLSEGALTQSFTPSSYGLNFPTTGANNLYFDMLIYGTNQALSWAPVSHGGITATMINGLIYDGLQYVRVTLTGPVATPSQMQSDNPGQIARPSLPQVFELVGRDSSGNAVVKYGFELKQWFVNRGDSYKTYSNTNSWCNKIGYRLPNVKDLTNASCRWYDNSEFCRNYVNKFVEATLASTYNKYMRAIGAGLSSEWGNMYFLDLGGRAPYTNANFYSSYWTQDRVGSSQEYFEVDVSNGQVRLPFRSMGYGVCVYP